MRKNRLLMGIAALGLGVILLAGCGGPAGGGHGENSGSGSGVENGSAGNGSGVENGSAGLKDGSGDGSMGAPGGENGSAGMKVCSGNGSGGGPEGNVPMGRYVEEELPLPEMAGQLSYITMLRGEGGRLELYLRTP